MLLFLCLTHVKGVVGLIFGSESTELGLNTAMYEFGSILPVGTCFICVANGIGRLTSLGVDAFGHG